MGFVWGGGVTIEPKFREEREEVRVVLSSGIFGRSQNLAKIFQYVCDRYIDKGQGDFSEYEIATEALGRQASFDPTQNATVRVEFHRLRERLQKYYETEGLQHALKITFQPGSYSPKFVRTPMVSNEGVTREGPLPIGRRPEFGGEGLPASPRRSYVFGAIVVIAALGAVILLMHWRGKSKAKLIPGTSAPAGQPSGPAATVSSEEVRIAAGYPNAQYIDRAGKIWGRDRYFEGGQTESLPRQFILRTQDPTLFQTDRFGLFSYHIPLRPGIYELHLYFAEQRFGGARAGGESSRIFNILLNGHVLLESFDPLKDAGGPDTATERVFKDVSPAKDGFLHLEFGKFISEPFVNAIGVVPGLPGKLRTVRIVEQPNCITDKQNHIWEPSRYFRGGQESLHEVKVEGTNDPDLYDGDRHGNFDYEIPVDTGRYTVRLYFAENFIGAKNTGGAKLGVGARVFDVYCNGQTLLRNFDIFKEAGGASRALVKTFHGLEPNGLGKLRLEFVPGVKENACVSAIEVESE
jgi:hypothetical protein